MLTEEQRAESVKQMFVDLVAASKLALSRMERADLEWFSLGSFLMAAGKTAGLPAMGFCLSQAERDEITRTSDVHNTELEKAVAEIQAQKRALATETLQKGTPL